MTQEQAPGHPTHGLALGTQAPDFSLATSGGARVSLNDFRGRQPVLLVFYRGWW
jgi:peroxiredoxin